MVSWFEVRTEQYFKSAVDSRDSPLKTSSFRVSEPFPTQAGPRFRKASLNVALYGIIYAVFASRERNKNFSQEVVGSYPPAVYLDFSEAFPL